MITSAPEAQHYSFNNDDPQAVDRHQYLGEMLDEHTFARLSSLGSLTGRRCLELGAGGGSVASWLAEQVGPTGQVVATDLNPRYLPTDAGYSVLRHDLRTDPVPDGPWDVIHARLVLMHIPERREILKGLAAALAPDGSLVLEEWATSHRRLVLAAPDAASAGVIDEYHDALLKVMPARGNDPTWADQVHGAMLAEGLIDVSTDITSTSWSGGTAGALLVGANVAQLRDDFASVGFTDDRVAELEQALNDSRLVMRSHYLYSTIGRKRAWVS
jgi:ubiquinone/menaquinone biosynthesis C-methylase UbiE